MGEGGCNFLVFRPVAGKRFCRSLRPLAQEPLRATGTNMGESGMRKIIGYSRLGCLFLFLLAAVGESYGQGGADGTILGTVIDSSGAVVPKASVEVTNVGTGVTQYTITNDSGEYSVPSLHPDQYRVT